MEKLRDSIQSLLKLIVRSKQITWAYELRWRNRGLKASSHDRFCESHSFCGEHVTADDLIRFKYCFVNVDGAPKDAVKACRIRDGTESYVIVSLPRHLVVSNKERYIGKYAQIVELYEDSDNRKKRLKIDEI